MSWDPRNLPSRTGTTYVVTGGNAGIGYFTSEQLASTGARVILASRSEKKADAAIASIREQVPGARLAFVHLDLTSLASVREAAAELRGLGPIDGLINNAGQVGGGRRRQTTADGLERIVGGNFLGHFALTAQVFPALAPTGRVVGLGSDSTRMVRLDVDDLYSERRYRPFRAYAFSKHAVQGFAYELDRRLRAAGSGRMSLLAHPGFSSDGLAPKRSIGNPQPLLRRIGEKLIGFVGQGKDRGAWPSVRAVLDPDAESGEYYGPAGRLSGLPILTTPVASSPEPAFGAALWTQSEELAGIDFTF